MTPGATINGWNNITVNGTNGGFRILFEGQESSSSLDPRVSDESQPSVEAIQEFSLQTSNFAPEFGIVTGGLYNFTSRSGTNQFHGSGYIYLQNTAFNAGLPFTDLSGAGTGPLRLSPGLYVPIRHRATDRHRLPDCSADRVARGMGTQLRFRGAVRLHRRRQQPGYGI
jgi:hypothetical protein